MINEEFILLHREDDVRSLALKKVPEGVELRFCLQQIEGWQTACKKLPRWASTEGILFPPRISVEQCSSDSTATYKRQLAERLFPAGRLKMLDMTGGFGIDFSFLAPLFSRAVYVERQDHLCVMAEHNFPLLGLQNAEVICGNGEDVLAKGGHYSLIYLDPARRDDVGRKVVGLRDCTPDVTVLREKLLAQADVVMLKLSPMLDVHKALEALPQTREVHVVSVNGECKELLLILSAEEKQRTYHCVNMAESVSSLEVSASELTSGIPLKLAFPSIFPEYTYLYEPNASILKAGVQDVLCERMNVQKLHPFSHLMVSRDLIEDFPGRCFQIQDVKGCTKRDAKELADGQCRANLTVRNFPASVAELRKKWNLKEGGDVYLFATTLSDGSHALIKCGKINPLS